MPREGPPKDGNQRVTDFPLVCVGGSAGGLDAYIRLLRHLPSDMDVAIVIVNHLRAVPTLLHEILPNYTAMPVDRITDGMLNDAAERAVARIASGPRVRTWAVFVRLTAPENLHHIRPPNKVARFSIVDIMTEQWLTIMDNAKYALWHRRAYREQALSRRSLIGPPAPLVLPEQHRKNRHDGEGGQ